jgi:subtilase family serine protease
MRRCWSFSLTAAAFVLAIPGSVFAQVSPALKKATVAVTNPSANTAVSGTVWLTLPGETALEQQIAAIYDAGSPQYHRFMTWQTLAPFLPTAAQVQTVQAVLEKNNLTVTATDANNLNVSFQGTAGDFAAAFHTNVEMHTLANGKQVRAFTAAPALADGAAGLVRAVTGVEEVATVSDITPDTGPVNGSSQGETPQQAAVEAASATPPSCIFPPSEAGLLSADGALPDAVYNGPIYGAALSTSKLNPTGKCNMTPNQYFAQSGLDKVHNLGLTGKGQTIAILENIGSPTLASDLEAFDTKYGLPAANLQIVNLAKNPTATVSPMETTLDVEWAHAVAPDAKLIVVETDQNSGESGLFSLQYGLSYVIENHLADVVSMSYGWTELTVSNDFITTWNEELMLASSQGVSVNVSSGDYGDRVADEGMVDVNVPADSPYATGVGGLSVFDLPGTSQLYKTAWGRDLTLIGVNGVPLAYPENIPHIMSTPVAGGGNILSGMKFGSGGGVSTIFPVPGYQAKLGGTGRNIPDVSDIADGYTGLKILVTLSTCKTNPCVQTAGGTSLAAPVFSAKLAILNQLNGASLGQAAPLIAQYASTPAVEDIVPLMSITTTGAEQTTTGYETFSANRLANPQTTQPYVSALWEASEANASEGVVANDDYVISFGTDSSLAVTPGYDHATGWGQLNLNAIIEGLVPSLSGK